MSTPNRPEPEAFLTELKKEGRGKLKVFLGAAPGVGKTYAMLRAAARRKGEGRDVVIGIVETHGRKETEALVHDLEVIPRQTMNYRGKVFQEMDTDALLERKPELALVDEMAHTNIEGSRHTKRYQDIEELLANGIDVYTTLNIQHLESLNDIIQRITWVKVRETLPDSALKLADEIELIDLPPEELIQRLREGKVYMPDQAQMAIRHYFSKGNLTALRELAMRTAAEQIDRDMIHYMQTHGVPGPWPVRERLIACVDESDHAVELVRLASRKAGRDKMPWIVLHVESSTDYFLNEREQDNTHEALRLAEELGGEVVTIQGGSDIANDILSFARSRNATRILIGRNYKSWLNRMIFSSKSKKLVEKAKDFDVTLMHATVKELEGSSWFRNIFAVAGKPTVREFGMATLSVIVATAAGWVLQYVIPDENLPLIYLLAVLYTAVRYGLWPSIYTVVLSLLAYNFFFTEPIFTFTVYQRGDIATLMFFPIIAIVIGNMAVQLKNQVEALRAAARRNAQMHDFTKKLGSALTLDDILQETVYSVSQDLQFRTAVLLRDPKGARGLYVASHHPMGCELSDTDFAAAEWAWKNTRPAGAGSDTLPAAKWFFVPLKGPKGTVAVLGTSPQTSEVEEQFFLSPPQRSALFSYCDQAALAIERALLAEDIEETRLLSETEKLRSALLSSISHDLRTPLVSIIGSATTMQELDQNLSVQSKSDLLGNILDEAERLNRFVQNLLDMTRLGHGNLQIKQETTDFRDMVGRAAKRMEKALQGHEIKLDADPDWTNLMVDPVLMEQVFVNILDNASKYAPADTPITITFERKDQEIVIKFTDEGPGIPAKDREHVFDMFYRVRSKDSKIAGTGLGLAICRGLVEVHGGRIYVDSGPGGKGASIVIIFPLSMAGISLTQGGRRKKKENG